MSKEIEELLASVSDILISETNFYPSGTKHKHFKAILRERLGPLLEAGQAMRDEMRKDIQEHEAAWSAVVLENNWDAALAAGK